MENEKRFILIENSEFFSNDGKTKWWFDLKRPLPINFKNPFIAVQCYADKDPNNFVFVENLRLLFTDQAEYYAVCPNCYSIYARLQWSGSTHNSGWRIHSQAYLEKHQKEKGWCEFCDPIFGNGGWRLD